MPWEVTRASLENFSIILPFFPEIIKPIAWIVFIAIGTYRNGLYASPTLLSTQREKYDLQLIFVNS